VTLRGRLSDAVQTLAAFGVVVVALAYGATHWYCRTCTARESRNVVARWLASEFGAFAELLRVVEFAGMGLGALVLVGYGVSRLRARF
jgi:hypothetical protein